MTSLNPVNIPIPTPRPVDLPRQVVADSVPVVSQTESPAALDIQSRIDLAHQIVSHQDNPQTVAFPDLQARLEEVAQARAEALGSAEAPMPDWNGLKDEVSSEAARISKIRAGFKGQINQERMASFQAALGQGSDAEKVTDLAAALKKAGFGSDAVIGNPPTPQGVETGLRNYLDSVRNDFHLRPRSWH
jgi:hypothetical protein